MLLARLPLIHNCTSLIIALVMSTWTVSLCTFVEMMTVCDNNSMELKAIV